MYYSLSYKNLLMASSLDDFQEIIEEYTLKGKKPHAIL